MLKIQGCRYCDLGKSSSKSPCVRVPSIRLLTSTKAETIRVLVWILSFMSFGYATGEFEVTSERLGVYRPEEHIGKLKTPCKVGLY